MTAEAKPLATGRVLQVNVSPGGVPKLPVERAWVGPLGLDGDGHNDITDHGGPHRAVCLFAMEAIERLQSEGHPIEPGGAGENLTTTGIEWSLLAVGARARIGDQLEIELASSTTPCATQKRNFSDGRFSRINVDLHPSDSRMYARVLREGEVRPGDPITVLAPAPDSRAADQVLMGRLDRAETRSAVAAWRAAVDAGYDVHIVEDGELAMSASAQIPGPAFNHASGFARLPNLLHVAQEFFEKHGSPGWITTAGEPWPGAVPSLSLEVFAAEPDDVVDTSPPDDVVIREIGPEEGARYGSIRSGDVTAGGISTPGIDPWPRVYENLARTRSRHLFVAEIKGHMVANASLHVSARTGWLRGALVEPQARGRGIQRALVAARVRAAERLGCNLVGASAEAGSVSARNITRMGMRQIGIREHYLYVPAGVKAPTTT